MSGEMPRSAFGLTLFITRLGNSDPLAPVFFFYINFFSSWAVRPMERLEEG